MSKACLRLRDRDTRHPISCKTKYRSLSWAHPYFCIVPLFISMHEKGNVSCHRDHHKFDQHCHTMTWQNDLCFNIYNSQSAPQIRSIEKKYIHLKYIVTDKHMNEIYITYCMFKIVDSSSPHQTKNPKAKKVRVRFQSHSVKSLLLALVSDQK